MTLILSDQDLPAQSYKNCTSLPTNQLGSFELVIPANQLKSRGYKRSVNLRYGLNLLIRDYWLQDVLVEERLPNQSGLELEFGFNVVGSGCNEVLNTTEPCSFLQFSETRTWAECQEWQTTGRLLKIDLHLTTQNHSQIFADGQLELIPSELQQAIANRDPNWCTSLGTITPATQLVLQKILNCPYQGSIQQIYLEGKALELIALQSAQFLDSCRTDRQSHRLKLSDIKRVHQARELVTYQLDNPPSLLDLARLVGLNDCTLKRGFRQVFGTTVFSYIRQQRLTKARQLLLDREMSVAEVACMVGYSYPSHFAAAFKREFGVSPKAFSNSGL